MPAGEAKTGAGAGLSSSEEVVAGLLVRLKEEVRHARGLDLSDDFNRGLVRQRLRTTAERFWPVTAERPLDGRTGARAPWRRPVKKVLRKLMRWYVEPFAADQRSFNDSALKLIDELFEEVDLVFGRLERTEAELVATRDDVRLVGEIEERLARLERRLRDGTAVAVASKVAKSSLQPAQAAFPDYFAFESRMRGATELVRGRQTLYVDDFRPVPPVLDVGCGRGELLALLRDAGIEARGVDADADMVAYARGEGLDVEQAELLAHLEGLADGSLGGIFAGQVVEHLPPPALLRLLELAHAKLRAGGLLVCETINPLSPLALRSYFADLTHAQPLVPETLSLLARQTGFAHVATRFLNPPPETDRLHPVELPSGPEFDDARAALAANVERLNELLYGPLDYAVLARA